MKTTPKLLMIVSLFLTFIFIMSSCSDSGVESTTTTTTTTTNPDPNPDPIPQTDTDKDGIIDELDNCMETMNADQSDVDNDGIGDVCDPGFTIWMKSDYVFDNYTYPVSISIPEAFETNKNLPIIYVLDGEILLEHVQKSMDPKIPVIMVGIGDLLTKGMLDRREVDMIPSEANCYNRTGRSIDFYNFITKQVIPTIENEHGIEASSRSLVGYSHGGIFSFVSLFLEDIENVMFHDFISIDPGLRCDPNYFTNLINNNNFSNTDKKFKLYLAVDGGAGLDEMRGIKEKIQEKEYSWLEFKYEEFLNDDHYSVLDPSLNSGLKFIFEE